MNEVPPSAGEFAWPEAPLAWSSTAGRILVFACDLDRWLSARPQAPRILARDEIERAQRKRHPLERDRRIAARALLRTLLAHVTAAAPQALEFAAGEHGKPYLPLFPDVRFNVSHSKNIGLYAIAHAVELGIDVEVVHALPDLEDVARATFEPAQFDQWRTRDHAARLTTFFEAFCRRESLLKAHGTGFLYGEPAALGSWSTIDLAPAPGVRAALTFAAGDLQVETWTWR